MSRLPPMERYLPPLTERGVRWVRFGALMVALIVLGWLTIRLTSVLTPLAIGLALAYILNPLVTWMEAHGVRRGLSTFSVFVVAGGVLAIIISFLLTATVVQAVELARELPRYAEQLYSWVNATVARISGQLELTTQPATRPALDRAVLTLLREHGAASAGAILGTVNSLASNVVYWVSAAVLIPLYTFFFLWNFNTLLRTIRAHLPSAYRDTIVRIAHTADRAMADFFRGRVIVCLLVGLMTAVGWWIVGVKYSLFLGSLAGALSLVPFIRILALPPALIFAYLEADAAGVSWVWPVVLAAAVFFAVDFLESFFVTPYITARSSGLHPLTTVVALLVGAEFAGLLGMLLSIPVASTLKSLAAEYLLPEIRALAADPAPAELPVAAPAPAPLAGPGARKEACDPAPQQRPG